jgi:hypothetical protein
MAGVPRAGEGGPNQAVLLPQVGAFAPSGFATLMLRMVPKLRESLTEQLLKKEPAPV